ncbi:MAG TPA: ABC transporter ATP-binding protein [Cellulomonas sp.]|nr:ABC transporter ATP-binding protein [Cellulomonas sp.]
MPDHAAASDQTPALELRGLWRRFGQKIAVAGIDLVVPTGSFYGLVGPNGAGKTTTLSMSTGLLTPDFGTVLVHGHDLWADPSGVKPLLGVLPDGVRLFDRLTGAQLITYAGLLHGLDRETVAARTADLLHAMALEDDARTLVVDYSAGMTKKVALACALVHAPRLLVLDEPFEAVDPVSAANIRDILTSYVGSGGTVIVSSHVMDLVQRMCDHVAVIAGGHVLAAGTVDEVRGDASLEERFVDLVGGRVTGEGLAWLRTSSD